MLANAELNYQTDKQSVSIIVPLLNEIKVIPSLISHLRHWQEKGCEILLIDGGSSDGSIQAIQTLGFSALPSLRGRAQQMNIGAKIAKHSALVFLHADTQLPPEADQLIVKALAEHPWGRFNVRIIGGSRLLPLIASLINLRSAITGIATGDQAIFVNKKVFLEVGGYPVQPLMEDIELSKRLKKIAKPKCLKAKVSTSGRRWLDSGIFPTILLMWRLRWAYWRGTSSEKLADLYRYHK